MGNLGTAYKYVLQDTYRHLNLLSRKLAATVGRSFIVGRVRQRVSYDRRSGVDKQCELFRKRDGVRPCDQGGRSNRRLDALAECARHNNRRLDASRVPSP